MNRPNTLARMPISARTWGAVWLVLFVAHAWLIRDAMQNGDCAVYNDQIAHRVAGIRTTHIGYMLLGFAFDTVLPFGVERNMNVMCLAFAAAGGAAAFAIARSLGASRAVAAMAPLVVFSVHAYLRGAVLAEVDVVACALIVVAVALRLQGHPAAGGAAFGAAMLVTPITALSTPMLVFASPGGRGWRGGARDVVACGLVALGVYLPVVGLVWQDYWYGGRGLLHAPRETWDVARQLTRSATFLLSSAGPWLALGLAALVAGVLSGTPLCIGVAVALVVAGGAGERFLDVPVQLPQLCLVAVLAVALAGRLPTARLRACLLGALWLSTAWPTYRSVSAEVRADVEARETFLAMASQTPKMIAAGLPDSWEDGLRFERIVYGRTKLGLGLSYRDFRNASRSLAAERRDHAVWLLSPAPPGIMAAFAHGWTPETRTVRGRDYEVWLPTSG